MTTQTNTSTTALDDMRSSINYLAQVINDNNNRFAHLSQSMDNRFQSIDDRFASIDKRFDEFSNRIDKKIDALAKNVDDVKRKVDGLAKEFHGYVGRENDIFEIVSNDAFAETLSTQNRLYKQLHLKEFYSLDSKAPLTDFDGLFLVDFMVPFIPKSQDEIESFFAHLPPKQRYKNAAKLVNQRLNTVQPHKKTTIVIIEAKHDVDKSKIDKKFEQLYAIEDVLNKIKAGGPAGQPTNQNCIDMMRSPDFQELLQAYEYDDVTKTSNIQLYFAARNWTRYLKKYVDDIHSDAIKTAEEYNSLTKDILQTHDMKFIRVVADAVRKYGVEFRVDVDHINNALATSNAGTNALVAKLQGFTTPFQNMQLQRMRGRIGCIVDGKVVSGPYSPS